MNIDKDDILVIVWFASSAFAIAFAIFLTSPLLDNYTEWIHTGHLEALLYFIGFSIMEIVLWSIALWMIIFPIYSALKE